ncbi:MAG: hypothetical protein ACK4UN_01305 [Limisphaerales bacterium]
MGKSRKVLWTTVAFGSCLAVLTGSLIVYGEMGKLTLKSSDSVSTGSYYYPDAQAPTSVQSGGTEDNGVTYGGFAWGALKVGYVGKNKIIQGSAEVNIPRLSSDKYGLVETNITVKRRNEQKAVIQTLQGKALVFANVEDSADAGYILVSRSEAETWVQVLNGNPDFVFNSSQSNIYPYIVKEPITNRQFTAYSLAEIAIKCGGAGDPPPGDGLTKIRDDLYLKRDGFIATPRPTAHLSTDKTEYKLGETVNIEYGGESYSVYDNGWTTEKLAVEHKDTGKKWDLVVNDKVVYNAKAASPSVQSRAAANTSQSKVASQSPGEQGTNQPAGIPFNFFASPDGKVNLLNQKVEWVESNLFVDTPHKVDSIPESVRKLPEGTVRIIVKNPPANMPKSPGTNWVVGTAVKVGWDGAVVLLDTGNDMNINDESSMKHFFIVWDKVVTEDAYPNPNGTNVIMVSLKAKGN